MAVANALLPLGRSSIRSEVTEMWSTVETQEPSCTDGQNVYGSGALTAAQVAS